MRIAIVNTDYAGFLKWHYGRHPELKHKTFAEQMAARNASMFGVADFYSRAFHALGHQAKDIHTNNANMQAAWAREEGMGEIARQLHDGASSVPGLTGLRKLVSPLKPLLRPLGQQLGLTAQISRAELSVLSAQFEAFKPDIIFNQELFYLNSAALRALPAASHSKITGFHGRVTCGPELNGYDLLVTPVASVATAARAKGLRVVRSSLAFGAPVLDSMIATSERDIDVSFVGSISDEHLGRLAMLEEVGQNFKLQVFGSGQQFLSSQSPLHECWKGEVWGREMYATLARSKITLNSHGDAVAHDVGNMRLYEATGIGTFLLTDWRQQLHELFQPGVEVETWKTPKECIEKIAYFLDRGQHERNTIAAAGQTRTLASHTYDHRARTLLEEFAKLL